MYRKNPVFNVTTFSASSKSVAVNFLKKQKFAVSVIANLDSQIDIILDESSTKAQKDAAIALLKDSNTILYTQISRESCASLCKKLEQLNFKDWLLPTFFKKGLSGAPEYNYLNLKKVDGKDFLFRLAKPVVTYTIKNGTNVEFHIQWTYDIPPVFETKEQPVPPPPPTEMVTVSVSINTDKVQFVDGESSSKQIESGSVAEFRFTLQESASIDDLSASEGTFSAGADNTVVLSVTATKDTEVTVGTINNI